jgi:hypothetical protein
MPPAGPASPRAIAPALIGAAGAAAWAMRLVAQQTIDVVRARHLLPRWDLAAHLGHGWLDYHLLATGQVHRLAWDLWNQGYWPPGLSLFQVPFYLALGGELTSGLWSAAAAFVLTAATGAFIVLRLEGGHGLLSACLFVSLLISSPFLLAYASVTMTEMLGALAQLAALACYLAWRQRPDAARARAFAVALTALFFVKYNYFVLLAIPLALHEWLERTAGRTPGGRLASLRRSTRTVLSSPAGLLAVVYVTAVLLVMPTGGFRFEVFGQRVSVRSIGNSGHVVLYLLLLRVWYLHRRGRIDWQGLFASDTRARPLLIWFVVPVTAWLASPYPNHLRDFANLVVNRPLGDPAAGGGPGAYLDALRSVYFFRDWVLALVVAAFGIAAIRYRLQPPIMRLLILAVPLQFAAIALHQTRFPRFLLLTVVLLCLTSAAEAGRWFAGSRRARAAAGLLAVTALASALVAARRVVAEERFRTIAFENYTHSDPLRAALGSIRGELTGEDRLVVVGQNNVLSPALFAWELGPPSGAACYPFPVGGLMRLDPALATHVLLVAALDPDRSPLDPPNYNPARLREILDDVERGGLRLRREFALADLQVSLRLYARTAPPPRTVECRR